MIEPSDQGEISGPCPLCGGVSARTLFAVSRGHPRFEIDQCGRCQLAWTRPASGEAWEKTGDFSDYYGAGKSKFLRPLQTIRDAAMRSRARRYLSFLTPFDEIWVLDWGCAEGRLLKAFLRYGCRCFGVEHPDYPEERFFNPDQITYIKGEAALETLPLNRFDLIFLWHVIEHVQEPMALMRRLLALLSEDGLLVMAVPNFAGREACAFKENWFHLDVPYHRFHFSKPALRRLVTDADLQVARSSEFCLEQGPYGLIQSTLNAMGWRFNECYEALKGNLNPRRIPLLACQVAIGLFLAIPALVLSVLHAKEGRGAVLKMTFTKGEGTPPRTKGR
jgi:SAM-dependent methyltransferase